MGIDIREGPNLACINCGLCVDACDSTMSKVGRERGLIDYEAWTNIERGRSGSARKPVRLVRPKIVALTLALVAILATVVVSVSTRSTISMTVAHERNPIAVALSEGRIRNAYEVRLSRVSQGSGGLRLEVNGQAPLVLGVVGEGKFDDGIAVIPLEAGQSRQLRVTVAGTPDLAGDLTFALIDEASGDRVEIVNFFKLP
jgi:polyferredoxin